MRGEREDSRHGRGEENEEEKEEGKGGEVKRWKERRSLH